MSNLKYKVISFFALSAALLIIQACAVNPVTGKRELMLISEEQEIAMGKQYDPTIVAQYGLYQDEKLQQFINEKGKQMGAISHRPNLNYQFRILDSPVVNAFAVPGGYVYFTRGIMAHFNNEAEFAGVLGHEIGHVTARHSAAQMSKQQAYGIGLMGGMIASEGVRQNAGDIQQALGLMFLKHGRDDESQSDALGVEYSTQIGYDSKEMANFFQVLHRLQAKSGQQIPTFMSTHPDPVDRFNKVHQLTEAYQQKTGATNLKINRNEYLRRIEGIVYGEDPRQGYVKYNTFFHPDLKFFFPVPTGWRVHNSPQAVQMASEDQKAAMIFSLSQQKTLQAAAQETVEKDGLQVQESQEIKVNGLPAVALLSSVQRQAQQGQQAPPPLRVLTYLIQYNGLIYKFHGMSEASVFNNYYRTFNSTMSNFDELRDPQMINVTPDRIEIKTVRRNASLQQVLADFGVPRADMEETAVLNNMELNDQLPSGMLIKIIKRGIGNYKTSS